MQKEVIASSGQMGKKEMEFQKVDYVTDLLQLSGKKGHACDPRMEGKENSVPRKKT